MFCTLFLISAGRKSLRVTAVIPIVLCVASGSRAAIAGLLLGAAYIAFRSSNMYIRLFVVPLCVLRCTRPTILWLLCFQE